MSLYVFLSGMFCVLGCIRVVAVRQVSVLGRFFIVPGFVMVGGLVVVARSMLMVFGGLLVMVRCFL
jgi:hypothetical protein